MVFLEPLKQLSKSDSASNVHRYKYVLEYSPTHPTTSLSFGHNQDGVITTCGIVSHQLQEEIIPEVFVLKLHGNEAQNLQEHIPKLRQPTCSLNYHIILV